MLKLLSNIKSPMAKRKQHEEKYEFHILPQGWKHILHEMRKYSLLLQINVVTQLRIQLNKSKISSTTSKIVL